MGIRSEDFTCQWCRTLSGIVSFMMFHDVANIAAVSHGSFLICPKMDRCNLIWYCIETVHGTQMCTLFPPTKIESCAFMWNMYTNIYPSPKIHESTIVVVCRFRGAWRATWQLVGIVGGQRFYAHSLGALVFYVFFMANVWRPSLKRTAVKHLKHWGCQADRCELFVSGYLLGSGKLMEGIRCDYDGSTDEHEDGQGLWVVFCFLLLGHESYVDCLLTFLHVNNLLILLEQWCVHVFWSHSWV